MFNAVGVFAALSMDRKLWNVKPLHCSLLELDCRNLLLYEHSDVNHPVSGHLRCLLNSLECEELALNPGNLPLQHFHHSDLPLRHERRVDDLAATAEPPKF